ncbi:nuclease-related domain-containing protein [Parvularcula dongshanensis]|uniref:NERD domain-containing protein n=1 Tax=Parvularcula dongshanensis TaxID=1173995 RepID=A0A840I1Y7_9PROT|nr:nuclease-related domain-containing protein [Parvularcula dongshanensis]MBB4658272.1 hypothetical protein [Parvularcula dongshanensis]
MRVFKRKKSDRTPFRPLRQRMAAQSLRARLLDEVPATLAGLTLIGSAFWIGFTYFVAPNLMVPALGLMFLVGTAWFGLGILRMQRLAKGAQAEDYVGAFLQTLERRGAYVLHDLCRDGFNIDHLVIAPSGLYVIETKYASKSGRGRDEIACRDGVLYRNGRQMRGDALSQVTRACEEVARMTRALGYAPPLQPVVVFPGWWTKSEGPVWVLNEKAALRWIRQRPAVMTAAETRQLYRALRAPAAEGAAAA